MSLGAPWLSRRYRRSGAAELQGAMRPAAIHPPTPGSMQPPTPGSARSLAGRGGLGVTPRATPRASAPLTAGPYGGPGPEEAPRGRHLARQNAEGEPPAGTLAALEKCAWLPALLARVGPPGSLSGLHSCRSLAAHSCPLTCASHSPLTRDRSPVPLTHAAHSCRSLETALIARAAALLRRRSPPAASSTARSSTHTARRPSSSTSPSATAG